MSTDAGLYCKSCNHFLQVERGQQAERELVPAGGAFSTSLRAFLKKLLIGLHPSRTLTESVELERRPSLAGCSADDGKAHRSLPSVSSPWGLDPTTLH